MNQLANSLTKKNREQERKAVLRLELDYELATLYDAIQENDEKQKQLSLKRLKEIRNEMISLNVF